jgi:glycosyltransferase involved in cell wall biosynthesis
MMKAVEENPDLISRAHVVVGIPSYNEAASIAVPTQEADKGLSKYFGDYSCVIINCDNNSPDNTREAFMSTSTSNPKIYISTPEGVKGKGNNLRNLFAKAVELEAQAVIVVDADLTSITPEWIRNLGQPLFEDFSFVSPLYVRHKYDGMITNNLAYPLTRALYGRRVRQPIGGDFGFSGDLARSYLESNVWTQDVAEFGIDIWMTSLAMISRAQVIQSFMARPKINKPKDPGTNLVPIFLNVVSTIFDLMCDNDGFWREVKWSRPTAVFGYGLGDVEIPPDVVVDTRSLGERFIAGADSFREIHRACLSDETFSKLQEASEVRLEAFELPPVLWAKVLYDFAVAYKRKIAPRDDLLHALIPLYYGRALSFVLETEAMNNQQVEELIEDQCLQFEKCKRYLLEKWLPD